MPSEIFLNFIFLVGLLCGALPVYFVSRRLASRKDIELGHMNTKLAKKDFEAEKIQKQLDALIASEQKTKQTREEREARLKAAEKELAGIPGLMAHNLELRQENETLRARLSNDETSSQELSRLKEELAGARQQAAASQEELAVLAAKIQEPADEQPDDSQELIAGLEDENGQLRLRLADLEQQLQQRQADFEQQLRQRRETETRLKEESAQRLAETRERVKTLEVELEKLRLEEKSRQEAAREASREQKPPAVLAEPARPTPKAEPKAEPKPEPEPRKEEKTSPQTLLASFRPVVHKTGINRLTRAQEAAEIIGIQEDEEPKNEEIDEIPEATTWEDSAALIEPEDDAPQAAVAEKPAKTPDSLAQKLPADDRLLHASRKPADQNAAGCHILGDARLNPAQKETVLAMYCQFTRTTPAAFSPAARGDALKAVKEDPQLTRAHKITIETVLNRYLAGRSASMQ